ncbi:MAG: hypothetical protein K6G15_11485 [Desulfovibrio sp.]|nr:hypothetical protein [Desulfovibrio sp.]
MPKNQDPQSKTASKPPKARIFELRPALPRTRFSALLTACCEKMLRPEALLRLEKEVEPLPADFCLITREEQNAIYNEAISIRYPKILELYIKLNGMHSAELIPKLCTEMVLPIKMLEAPNTAFKSFASLHRAGLSLSWWLFGLDSPLRTSLRVETVPWEMSLADHIRTMRFKQGWNELESRWMITQTHGTSQKKLEHKILCRLMSGLPQIKLFPLMPSVVGVFERLENAVLNFVPPADCEPWIKECYQMFKQSPWRCCVLMLVRQGSISHWQVVKQRPRRKSERLAYVLNLIFDLYGENEGLVYYLRVLNEEARAQGFANLSEVVRDAVWNRDAIHPEKD